MPEVYVPPPGIRRSDRSNLPPDVHTGLRQGALLALQWDDLDLEAGTLRVRRTVTHAGGEYSTSEPETKKSRSTVRLTAGAALREHQPRQM